MPPPPLPFFSGRSVSASETDDGMLAIRPLRGHAFTSPPGTQVLYLPIVSLIRATVQRLADPAWSTIVFAGEFRRVSNPSPTSLSPVASADADALVAAVNLRFGLPRIARWCAPWELHDAREVDLVRVVGTWQPGHFEAADFDGLKLRGEAVDHAALVPGRRYRVTAIFTPGTPQGSDGPRRVGYGGAYLHVQTLAPADAPELPRRPLAPVIGPRLQVAARSVIGRLRHHHQEAAAVLEPGDGPVWSVGSVGERAPLRGEWSRRRGAALVVLDGMGGQHTGDIVCETAIAGLVTRFADAPPADRAGRAGWLTELMFRVSQHVRASSRFNGGGAAVAVALIVDDELHVVHLGDVRVYHQRDGRLRRLTTDHTLRNDPMAAGLSAEQLAAVPDNVLTRGLGWAERAQIEVTSLDLSVGDVVMLASCGVYRAVEDDALQRMLGEPDVGGACAAIEAAAELGADPDRNDNISVIVARVDGPL